MNPFGLFELLYNLPSLLFIVGFGLPDEPFIKFIISTLFWFGPILLLLYLHKRLPKSRFSVEKITVIVVVASVIIMLLFGIWLITQLT